MDAILIFLKKYSILISLPLSLLSAVILLLGIFLLLIERDKLKFLSFAEPFARRWLNNFTLQENFPGRRYPSYIPEGEHAEKEFYAEFANVLSKAKVEIFNSGDGFNMTSPADGGGKYTSRQKANILDHAIVRAMEENPSLVYTRFQILSACNINWVSRMIFLKQKFGDRFRVYVNHDFDHIGCFCIVDPDSKNCVFEWQLVSGRSSARGTISKGFGFVYKNKEICAVMKSMFRDIRNAPATNGTSNDPDKRDGLSVESLQDIQKNLWDHAVKGIYKDPTYTVIDDEITQAFINRGLDKKKFRLADMDFRPENFPPLSLEE